MKLDCQKCIGACCTIAGSVTVSDGDIERLSRYVGISTDEFKTVRVTVENGNPIIKSSFDPCPFLKKGQCSVYEARPDTCREYHCWDAKDVAFGIAKQLQEGGVTEGRLSAKFEGNELKVILNSDP